MNPRVMNDEYAYAVGLEVVLETEAECPSIRSSRWSLRMRINDGSVAYMYMMSSDYGVCECERMRMQVCESEYVQSSG